MTTTTSSGALSPGTWALLTRLGHEALLCGAHGSATQLFSALAALSPEAAYPRLALGLAADKRGEVAEARAWYVEAARLDPRDPYAELDLAELALADGAFDEATRRARRAECLARARGAEVIGAKARALAERGAALAAAQPISPDKPIPTTGPRARAGRRCAR